MWYGWRGKWIGLLILESCCSDWRWLFLFKIMYSVLFTFTLRPMPPAAFFSYAGGILLGLVYEKCHVICIFCISYSFCGMPLLMWKYFLLLDLWMFEIRSLGRVLTNTEQDPSNYVEEVCVSIILCLYCIIIEMTVSLRRP